MRKNKKIILIVLFLFISFLTIIIFSNTLYATTTSEIISAMNTAKNGSLDSTKSSSILYLLSKIFSLIQFIGTGISMIVVLKLGITYMMSSVEEKAEIKKKAVPICIGSFIIVATVNIMKFIQDLITTSLDT